MIDNNFILDDLRIYQFLQLKKYMKKSIVKENINDKKIFYIISYNLIEKDYKNFQFKKLNIQNIKKKRKKKY